MITRSHHTSSPREFPCEWNMDGTRIPVRFSTSRDNTGLALESGASGDPRRISTDHEGTPYPRAVAGNHATDHDETRQNTTDSADLMERAWNVSRDSAEVDACVLSLRARGQIRAQNRISVGVVLCEGAPQ